MDSRHVSRSTSRWTRPSKKADQARAHHVQVSRGRAGHRRRSAGPTTAPIRPASTTSSSSCRSSRTTNGRRSSADRLADWFGDAPRTKAELIDEMNDELNREHRRRRLELLAEHPRQRHGVALRRQGRQLGQDHRPRPGRAGTPGRASRTPCWKDPRHQGRRHLPHQGPAEPGDSRRSARSAPTGASAWPTSKTSCKRPSAASRSRR